MARPMATMISGAAATTRGPPTCGATARSTPLPLEASKKNNFGKIIAEKIGTCQEATYFDTT